jgi:hypothetical protein
MHVRVTGFGPNLKAQTKLRTTRIAASGSIATSIATCDFSPYKGFVNDPMSYSHDEICTTKLVGAGKRSSPLALAQSDKFSLTSSSQDKLNP